MAQYNECMSHFAHAFVGLSDNGNLSNRRMIHEFVFNFCRIRIEAADDEHVFESIGDCNVAPLVHDANVAGMEPPISVNCLRCCFGIGKVSRHHVVAAADDFARLTTRNFIVVLINNSNVNIGNGAPTRC